MQRQLDICQFTEREQELIRRGYDQEFICRCNEISELTKQSIVKEVFDYIVKDAGRTADPAAVFIGGQPGCGKSTLARMLRTKQDGQELVDVSMDHYRTWHPFYEEIERAIRNFWNGKEACDNQSPGNDMANFTHRFAADVSDLLIDMLSTPQNGKCYSMCIEWGMRKPDEPLACMRRLKEKGYRNEVIFLCVPQDVSLKSCRLRADCMNSGKHIFRRVPESFQRVCAESITESCAELLNIGKKEEGLISRFTLRDRHNTILWTETEESDPIGLYRSILAGKSEQVWPNSLDEAKKTYYSEAVGILKNEKWFAHLFHTDEARYNVERVSSIERSHRNYVLNYVEKTLLTAGFDEEYEKLPEEYRKILIRSLQWAEAAKTGTAQEREEWTRAGYDLSVHNTASACIYRAESEDDMWIKQTVSALIEAHGMPGQMLRGETTSKSLLPLLKLIREETVDSCRFEAVLRLQNKAIVSAASEEIWKQVQEKVYGMLRTVCRNKCLPPQLSVYDRIKILFPKAYGAADSLTEREASLYSRLLSDADLWYPQAALDTFGREEIVTVFDMIAEYIGRQKKKVNNISFERLMRTLYYDYEGKRRINIYKKRIIEYCLRKCRENAGEPVNNPHVCFALEVSGATLFFDVKFTAVCESLLAFCVEAERSGLMEYQKNIVTIFDLFGFRKDIFDRLNNEDKYLETMNDTAKSRKNEIIDYVRGESVVDVGSGGGILLDLLEKRFPEMQITGTDISSNVIEALESRIRKEGHHYAVRKHNFVDGSLEIPVDNILFSSILHEVYSYTVLGDRRFQIESVRKVLYNAMKSLRPGGRIIIRDGVLSEPKGTCRIRLKTAEGVTFAANYLRDFGGLQELRRADGSWDERYARLEGDTLIGDVNLIREFLYTYTWGVESYSCEINEQFGYYSLKEYTRTCEQMGLRIIHAESYLEPGYPQHLNPLVELEDGLCWDDMPSSCFIVAQNG